jgi:hypothetical protein
MTKILIVIAGFLAGGAIAAAPVVAFAQTQAST